MKNTRGLAVLLLSLTFVVGAMAGMAIEEATGIDWFEFLDETDEDDSDAPDLMAGITLTEAQRERIDDIADAQEDRLENYWEARVPEIKTVVDSSYAQIRALLTPAQQAVFDRRVRELDGRIPQEFRD